MAGTRDRIALAWGLGILALALAGAAVGFVLLPSQRGQGLWDSICIAVGLPADARPRAAAVAPAAPPPSDVAWTGETLRAALAGNPQAAAPLVQQCAACHGTNGMGTSDAFPNLAAQVPDAIYKQLMDFKTGRRVNAVMSPWAQPLSGQQMADLAAHYARLAGPPPRLPGAPTLVTIGDPMRNIAPCAVCHGGVGVAQAAPTLAGQKEPYLQAQLQAFADGSRRNDINAQMRVIAKAMTAEEMRTVAAWYAALR